MIIANIIGGLGNQMFQYACGRSLSLRLGCELKLATDQYKNYKLHNGFELHNIFNIKASIATKNEIQSMLGWRSTSLIRRILSKNFLRQAHGKNFYSEPSIKYWPEVDCICNNSYVQGYWQSEKYFEQFEVEIRKDFLFLNSLDIQDLTIVSRMNLQPSASLHIRRGDYLSRKNLKLFKSCDLDYYQNAIRIMRSRVPKLKLFIFTDDPDWVQAKFSSEFGNHEFVRHNSGVRNFNDMRLMSLANHHIIANSSFSWWGAWLNPSPDKMVIAPGQWFQKKQMGHDLIPKGWIQI